MKAPSKKATRSSPSQVTPSYKNTNDKALISTYRSQSENWCGGFDSNPRRTDPLWPEPNHSGRLEFSCLNKIGTNIGTYIQGC